MSAPLFKVSEPTSSYSAEIGHFGMIRTPKQGKAISWESCRETFHYYVDAYPGYYSTEVGRYYFSTDNPDQVMSMVGWVEDQLGIRTKTNFRLDNNYRAMSGLAAVVLEVIPAPFWKFAPYRHQFLSCCMRAALNPHGSHAEKLSGYKYFVETPTAFVRFMQGNTLVDNAWPFEGWVSYFNRLPESGFPAYHDRLRRPTEEDINLRAYHLWAEAGKPGGYHTCFWEQANTEVIGA